MAFGGMIGLAAGELDEDSWDTFQLEVNQCLVKARRATRERRKAAESRRHLQPQGDFAFASNIAAQQQQSLSATVRRRTLLLRLCKILYKLCKILHNCCLLYEPSNCCVNSLHNPSCVICKQQLCSISTQ